MDSLRRLARVGTAFPKPGGKEERQTAQEGHKQRERKRGVAGSERRIGAIVGLGRMRQPPTWSARPCVDIHAGGRPSTGESQFEGGTNQSREPPWVDRERRPLQVAIVKDFFYWPANFRSSDNGASDSYYCGMTIHEGFEDPP